MNAFANYQESEVQVSNSQPKLVPGENTVVIKEVVFKNESNYSYIDFTVAHVDNEASTSKTRFYTPTQDSQYSTKEQEVKKQMEIFAHVFKAAGVLEALGKENVSTPELMAVAMNKVGAGKQVKVKLVPQKKSGTPTGFLVLPNYSPNGISKKGNPYTIAWALPVDSDKTVELSDSEKNLIVEYNKVRKAYMDAKNGVVTESNEEMVAETVADDLPF